MDQLVAAEQPPIFAPARACIGEEFEPPPVEVICPTIHWGYDDHAYASSTTD